MSVHLPGLPIERVVLGDPEANRRPLALAAREGAREVVKAASRVAALAGVREGLPVAAARAICAGLEVRPHVPEADRALLRRLACLQTDLTPDVVLDEPEGFLLEIARTEARFCGEIRIAEKVLARLRALGHAGRVGLASTRPAARALARSAAIGEIVAGPRGDPRPALLRLPVGLMDPPWEVAVACEALGVRTIGDLLRLPRAGVATRFGDDFLYQLDALVGAREDPVPRIVPPSKFSENLDLLDPTDDAGTLAFAAKRLFDLAEADLATRDRGVEEIRISLGLCRGERVAIDLRPSRPTREARTFLRLFQYRLEKERLPGPVADLHLQFERTVPIEETQHLLFEEDRGFEDGEESLDLKDRLSVRLGEEHVSGAVLVDDHRPERAFHLVPARVSRKDPAPPAPGPRPIEVAARPQHLAVEADLWGRPLAILSGALKGELRLVRGPERIEAGWWDGDDVQRSYYEVETRNGAHLWLFRDTKTGAFFSQGAFS